MRRAALAAMLALGLASAARGAEPAPDARRDEVRTVVFGGLESGTASFASVGFKRAFDSLERDGPLVMAGAGYGARFERDGASPLARPPLVLRHTVLGHALAGWQWTYDWGVVALLAGPELSYERVGGAAPQSIGPRFGGRVHAEIWARPTQDTLLTGTLVAGSARGDLWTRLAWGWRLLGDAYVGPEVAGYGDLTGYRKPSVGVHVTAFAFWGVTFRLSAGWLRELPANRDGAYVSLAAWRAL